MKLLSLFLPLVLFLPSCLFAQTSFDVRLNQTGFYPEGEKLAAVINSGAEEFLLRSSGNDSVVFSGTLSALQFWEKSGESVRIADFSTLRTPGIYYLEVEGLGRSLDFFIGDRAGLGIARSALKAYYFNRASTAVTAAFGDKWARPAGHPDTLVWVHASAATQERPAGTRISAPKGWYDAGDYNKYIVNSGISTYTLLRAYQYFPAFFGELKTNIPESENGVPDILDEARWNLEWMLDMQDPNDGGVYHKLATANFSGAVMPHEATAPRYVVQKSTAAALNFAAVMALAYTVYLDIDPEFAHAALAAAREAYQWAVANPAVYYSQSSMNSQFDPDIHTGEYGDTDVADEFNWAATELYLATREEAYYSRIKLNYQGWFGPPGWSSVNSLALMSLLFYEEELAAAGKDVSKVRSAFLSMADGFLKGKKEAPYAVTINEFYWGSNALAANQGMVLLAAFGATQNREYLQAANASLDYLLGRNATSYSFVTGIGKKPPMNIHHRQSEADGLEEPVPGFLAGGPNPGQQDNCDYPSSLPARSYIDSWCSYASNEVTINWNAPLVFLAAGLESAYEENNFVAINQPPAAPGNVRVKPLGNSDFALAWDLLSSDVIRYTLERSEGDEEGFGVIAEPAGTILSYLDKEQGLKAGVPYYYRIKSMNTFGESAYSEVVSAQPGGSPTGILKPALYRKFRVFPNPSSGELQLFIPLREAGAPLTARIMDLQGQLVANYLLEGVEERFTLKVEGLKGCFILQLEGKSTLYAPQRIILQ